MAVWGGRSFNHPHLLGQTQLAGARGVAGGVWWRLVHGATIGPARSKDPEFGTLDPVSLPLVKCAEH